MILDIETKLMIIFKRNRKKDIKTITEF